MNTLIRKELRLLFPYLLMGLGFTFLLWLIPQFFPRSSGAFVYAYLSMMVACPAFLVTLTVAPWGGEIAAGTFGQLLAQPLSRERVWWTKALLLAVAVAASWMAWWAALNHSETFLKVSPPVQDEILLVSVLFAFAAYSGGLWMVLILRHVTSAFWLTFLAPAALIAIVGQFLQKHPEKFAAAISAIMMVYSVVGFAFARWLYLRAQDTPWTGGKLDWPRWPILVLATKRSSRPRSPRVALIIKELRLQQSQFIIAAVMVLIHGVIVAIRHFNSSFRQNALVEILVETFWILWLLMPLLIGCDAVAQERKFGTLEAQLCLPARRRTQFGTKLVITLLLSLIFGGVVPLLFEGDRILPALSEGSHQFVEYLLGLPDGAHFDSAIQEQLGLIVATLLFGGIPMVIGSIAFYVSTLTRSTVQALGPALVGVFVAILCFYSVGVWIPPELWRGWLGHLIGVPIVAGTLLALAFWNFKHVHVGADVWRRNLVVLLSSFMFVGFATTTVYHRAWEFFLTGEPVHDPARIAGREQATLQSDGGTAIVRMADGRAWACDLWTSNPRKLPGTNWACVERCYANLLGIQRDGSLWILPQGAFFSRRPEGAEWTRIGSETNWKSVVPLLDHALLLKTDGTLWLLGKSALAKGHQRPDPSAISPQPLDADADWSEISVSSNRRAMLRRSNGELWVSPVVDSIQEKKFLAPEITIQRAPYFELYKDVSERFGRMGLYFVGIGDDGSFRVAASLGWETRAGRIVMTRPQIGSSDAPIGNETNWVALAGTHDQTVTLRADGTLWKWNFPPTDGITPLNNATSIRLGTQSDWIGLAISVEDVVSLAADGSVWLWQLRSNEREHVSLLASSRHPKYLGNISDEGQR